MPHKGLPRCECGIDDWKPLSFYDGRAKIMCRDCLRIIFTRSVRGIRRLREISEIEKLIDRSGDSAMLTRTMPNLRESVLKELDRRKWSHYQLVVALKGKRPDGSDVPASTVYEFLRGVTTINSNYLGLICDALELKLMPRRK